MFCAYQRVCHKQDGGGDSSEDGERYFEVDNAHAFMQDFYNRISGESQ